MRKLTHQEILARQQKQLKKPRLAFDVLLNNIRSLYNVGSIFRTADAAGVAKIWLCGITGHPPNKQISKTALGAEDSVDWEYRENALDILKALKQKDYEIVLLEQAQHSCSHEQFIPRRSAVCLVIGNELTGVSDPLVSLCDRAVEIEMMGIKNSLNVAVAFGIMAYHVRHYLKEKPLKTKNGSWL